MKFIKILILLTLVGCTDRRFEAEQELSRAENRLNQLNCINDALKDKKQITINELLMFQNFCKNIFN